MLKPTERTWVLLKNFTRNFQNSLPFERSAGFYVTINQSMRASNVFNTLTLKQFFWKTKTFFKKLKYRFLVFSKPLTKIENTSIPFKTALSEPYVKTNSMAATKWTYHKEWSFASNYLYFFGKFVPVLEPLKKV